MCNRAQIEYICYLPEYVPLNDLKPGDVYICFRGLRVYRHCPFSCATKTTYCIWYCTFSCLTENEAMTTILILSILINHSYFQLNELKPGIYIHCRFSGSASLLALTILISGHNLPADCQWCTLVSPLNSGANAALASVQALV